MRNLQEDLKLCEKATPGPWEIGVWYCRAGVNDNSHKDWEAPKSIPIGKCNLCLNGRGTLAKEFKDDKGQTWHLHRFDNYMIDLECNETNEKEWYRVTSAANHSSIEEGGVCSKKEDGEFIAESREGWPYAIKKAIELESKIEKLKDFVNVVMEIWDTGLDIPEITDFIDRHNEKNKDYPEMQIKFIEVDGEKDIADIERLFILRSMAEEVLREV